MNGDQPGAQEMASAPPPAGGASAAASRVAGPAIGLMITAGVGIALQALGILVSILGINFSPFSMMGESQEGIFKIVESFRVLIGFVSLGIGVVVLIGALRMKALRGYALAMTATILAMVPCLSPCCLLGLPIGIWSLVVLLSADVKSAFRS